MVKMQTGHGSPVTLYDSTDTESGTAANPLKTTTSATPSTTLTTSQITVSATAVLILAANTARLGATVANQNTATVYIGQTSGVTATTGLPVPVGSAYNVDVPLYTGAIYGILASGTGQLVAAAELT